jgi:Short C-terminal domain
MLTGRMPLLRTALIGGVVYAACWPAAAQAAKHYRAHAPQRQPALPGSEEPGALEQLKQLGALRDSKILTEAEFETVKKKILDDL